MIDGPASWMRVLLDAAIIVVLILGIRQFRTPRSARSGNLIAALAFGGAFLLVLLSNDVLNVWVVLIATVIGSVAGGVVAMKVHMTGIPAMVAFQHGAGGVAALLVSFVELTGEGEMTSISRVSGLLGLVIGSATFSGSMIASGKLADKLKPAPVMLRAHGPILLVILMTITGLGVWAWTPTGPFNAFYLSVLILFSVLLGVLFSIRIGGADMPVLISFLNATAGLAAAFCGIIIQNRLLIACGATVAASGSILTHVMCRAMNRSLINVFVGIQQRISGPQNKMESMPPADGDALEKEPVLEKNRQSDEASALDRMNEVVRIMISAGNIIIIPGYGMALAQAQFLVSELASRLEKMGKEVKFAIHPVAGRMPGHMNVLLAEADVEYDKLFEMDDINPELKETDLALIVGACDIVNPAAISVEGTPISGMPILMAQEARQVVVCNLDENPGYSGVSNPLYQENKTILLLGDAKKTILDIINGLG